jgi:hypothetical protein
MSMSQHIRRICKTKYSRVAAFVGQKELDSVATRDLDKALAEDVVSDFVHTIVACKTFA